MRASTRSGVPSPADRLDSWKEIAAYLRRDVRTVQRWEERWGLPIHRLALGERAAVYAFREELDLWWRRNRSSIIDRSERSRPALRTAVALGLSLTIAGWLAYRHSANEKLERATTRSLDALELYTKAVDLGNRNEWGGAEQLTRRALMLDPEFAAAHNWLGWALHNQGVDESLPSFARALQLSTAVSESERYFISGSYHSRVGQLDRAASDYEALLQMEPEHYWGTNNLAYTYVDLGMHHKAAGLIARLADFRPNDLRLQARAAEAQLIWMGNRGGAQPYLERARTLLSSNRHSASPLEASWVEMVPGFLRWSEGRVQDALVEIDSAAATVPYRGTDERKYYARAVGVSYLTLGRVDAAESVFEQHTLREWRYLDLSMAALVRGDKESLRRRGERYAENFSGWGVPLGGQLLVRAGLLDQAEKVVEYAKHEGFQTWKVKLLEAELALARGDASETTLLVFQEVVADLRVSGTATYFLAAESLAHAWLANGDLRRAIAVLEASSEERHRSHPISVNSGGFSGSLWMRNRALLAELYRRAERHRDAERVTDGLRRDLSLADSGLRPAERAVDHESVSAAATR